jgi:hypothetical protein
MRRLGKSPGDSDLPYYNMLRLYTLEGDHISFSVKRGEISFRGCKVVDVLVLSTDELHVY